MKTAILLLLISLGLILWFPCPAATTNNPTLPISQLPDGNFPTALDRFVVNKWIPATTNFHTYTIDWAYIVGDDNNGMMPIVNNRAPTGWVSLVTGTLGTNATNFARASAAASAVALDTRKVLHSSPSVTALGAGEGREKEEAGILGKDEPFSARTAWSN